MIVAATRQTNYQHNILPRNVAIYACVKNLSDKHVQGPQTNLTSLKEV